jgi:hypothetical protein
MHDMGLWKVLMMLYEVFHSRRINIPMSLNGKEHMYISIQLVCIWWFKWCHIWMCSYTCVFRSSRIFVCLYIQVMISLIFMFGCACILVFSKVVEYLYACITMLWVHIFLCLDMHVCLYSPKLWSTCICI